MKHAPDYRANLASIKPVLSADLFGWLSADQPTVSRLIGTARQGWNIDLGAGRLLYPAGVDAYVDAQVAAFLGNPVRRISFAASNFLFEEDQFGPAGSFAPRPLDAESLAAKLKDQGEFIAARFAEGLLNRVDGAVLDWFPDADAGHLVCFGLGLGMHLPKLLEALPFRDLIIVDPYPEFLRHSLAVVDWQSLQREIKGRGGRLWFCIGRDANVLTEQVQVALRGPNYIRIDGAYMYQHYEVPPLPDIIRQIQERGPILELAQGFYEDEIRMVTHTVQHMLDGPARVLVDLPQPSSPMPPVVVLGSGPSADAVIGAVARLQKEGAVVISAGTGLGVALNNGIVPDLHCEIENTVDLDEGLRLLSRDHDLSTIPLLASWSVSPRTSTFFKYRVFYYRDSNAGSRLFAKPDQIVGLSGPTVANLACRAAIALGVQDIYLFGIDLGSRDKATHHSQKSAYNLMDDEFWRSGMGMDTMEIEVPGNRGGTVFTSRQFQLTRSSFELLIAAFPQTRFHNCSDGVRIHGTTTADPATVAIRKRNSVSPVEELLGRLGLPVGPDADFCRAGLMAYRTSLEEWWRIVDRILAVQPDTLDDIIDALFPTIEDGLNAKRMDSMGAIQASFAGSITSMLQLSYTVLRRLPEGTRPEVVRHIAKTMREILADAVQRAGENCRDLESKIPT